jgi:hypothetical protein
LRFFAAYSDTERAFFATFLLTGFREQEVMFLRWSDVTFQALSLLSRSACQFPSADTIGESEIVFDLICAARLSTGGRSFDKNSSQPLRCAVYSCAQSGGPCSINRKIVSFEFGTTKPIECGTEIPNGRPKQDGASLQDADGKAWIAKSGQTGESPRIVFGFQVDPFEREPTTLQEIA